MILATQIDHGISGAVAEIGVHHGKSFIPMALSNRGHSCYAIDLFEDQQLNVDSSGRGDKETFIRNLQKFGMDASRVFIDARPSTEVSPGDIERSVGKVRFFHIDGGHHYEVALSDLKLAEEVMADNGVIAIDDVFRPEWPEVSMALFAYLASRKKAFVPFAIGYNKTYLCQPGCADIYRAALSGSDFLRLFFAKKYQVSNEPILVFQCYPVPEWDVSARLLHYMKTYHPDFVYSMKKLLRRHGSHAQRTSDALEQRPVSKH